MKTTASFFLLTSLAISALLFSSAGAAESATWKPEVPDGYTPITWAKAPGIATFFKAPSGNGSIDFITRIYLPQNDIGFIADTSTPQDWGPATGDFSSGPATPPPSSTLVLPDDLPTTTTPATNGALAGGFHNFAFARIVAEAGKQTAPDARFIWNGPFFNVTAATSDLSLALKSTVGTSTLITSGSRPPLDMAKDRRMLIINNQTGTGQIADFEESAFVSTSTGDQALEGFAPSVTKTDGTGAATGRLFLGISADHTELVVYCSKQASIDEASAALTLAGITPENQLEADGGGSATCGYNLPGQFFVEPIRTLPLLMGATTLAARGTASTDGLNVRSGPSTKNGIVTKLAKGAAVRVFEEKNGWYRIGAGQWVSKPLIKKL